MCSPLPLFPPAMVRRGTPFTGVVESRTTQTVSPRIGVASADMIAFCLTDRAISSATSCATALLTLKWLILKNIVDVIPSTPSSLLHAGFHPFPVSRRWQIIQFWLRVPILERTIFSCPVSRYPMSLASVGGTSCCGVVVHTPSVFLMLEAISFSKARRSGTPATAVSHASARVSRMALLSSLCTTPFGKHLPSRTSLRTAVCNLSISPGRSKVRSTRMINIVGRKARDIICKGQRRRCTFTY